MMYKPPNTTSIRELLRLSSGTIAVEQRDDPLGSCNHKLPEGILPEKKCVRRRAWEGVTLMTINNCWKEGLGAAITDAVATDDDNDTDFLVFSINEFHVTERKLSSQLNVDQTLDSFIDDGPS